MTWKETCVMDERMRFVVAKAAGAENMSELCRHFGISRKCGYKWWNRFCEAGPAGLHDVSRAPLSNPRAVAPELVEPIVELRQRYPSWGPRKIKAWLEDHHGDRAWPCAGTIGSMLDAYGLTRPRKRRARTAPHKFPLAKCEAPNDVWCVDFKGWFVTGDGVQVEPFTLTDGHSRYLLQLEVLGRADTSHVWRQFEAAFQEFGLPRVVRSDNGSPFASLGAAGLSRLQVNLIKAGVVPERIRPGKPQQNGRHERMHLTLKQETCSPPADTFDQQLDRFRVFHRIFNHERPHEAIGQVPPARLYQSSPRPFLGRLCSPDYDSTVQVRKVRSNGEIKWQGQTVFISHALKGEPVGLYRIGQDTWLTKYGPIMLGTIKGKAGLVKTFGRGSQTCG